MGSLRRLISRTIIGAAAVTLLAGAGVCTANAATIPEAYQYDVDALQQEYPGTRSQGEYNTCWAFSAVGLAEFDLIHDDRIADKSIDLSELQLAYYTYHNEEDPFGGTYADLLKTFQYLISGGNLNFCTRALLQWQGLIPESDLPYDKAETTRVLDSSYAFSKDVAHLQNVYILDIHEQPQDVKKEIMEHGAAGISYYSGGSFGKYDTLAYYARTGDNVATFYCPTEETADHAVNIVGWDDNFPASNFKMQPQGNGAWLVRNSWSDTTGNDYKSYFWLSYYDKGLEDDAWVLDFEPADNYDFNYQYDGCALVYKGWNTPVCANVFQAQGADNEQLRAVSIAINEAQNVPYTIRIYTNLADKSNPRSGILAATVKGTTTYEGNYTIPLKKGVSLQKGTSYAVVVELGRSDVGIDVERSSITANFRTRAYIDYNQSFIYTKGSWHDLAEEAAYNFVTGNLCIKAFTDRSGANIGKVSKIKSTGVTKSSVKLSWTKVAGAKGYELYRATSKNGTYKKIATTTGTSYNNKKLSSKKTYYYKVRAYKKSGDNMIEGKLSSALKVKTRK